uniref:CSON007583 protein n=1 Tax=Culicoides sonorensis TaxID=179676 RepID=A0A336LYD5_CULSO
MEEEQKKTNSSAIESESNGTEVPESHSNVNIDAQDVDENLIEKVKGDAIGNTLYSQRFVLSTLMKLTKELDKPLTEDEDFEKDLCTLWDESVESDVVKFLLEYNCLELFTSVLDQNDVRLTEILVGIIGNMCVLPETRHVLETSPEITCTLISLISSTDSLILVQLMRLFQAMLVFENSGDEMIWFQYFSSIEDFVQQFAFVLTSSTSNTLLKHSLDALYAICAKFAVIEIMPEGGKTNFIDMFVVPQLVMGLIEAFRQVLGNNSEDNNEGMSLPTENEVKFMSLFLDVNVILTQYKEKSNYAYSEKLSDFLDCLSRILLPLCNKIYLLPLTTTHQGVIENLNDIFHALEIPFHSNIFNQFLIIFNLLSESKASKSKKESEWDSSDDEDSESGKIDIEDLQCTIIECLTTMMSKCENLDEIREKTDQKIIKTFLNRLKNCETGESVEELIKLKHILKKIIEEK